MATMAGALATRRHVQCAKKDTCISHTQAIICETRRVALVCVWPLRFRAMRLRVNGIYEMMFNWGEGWLEIESFYRDDDEEELLDETGHWRYYRKKLPRINDNIV